MDKAAAILARAYLAAYEAWRTRDNAKTKDHQFPPAEALRDIDVPPILRAPVAALLASENTQQIHEWAQGVLRGVGGQ